MLTVSGCSLSNLTLKSSIDVTQPVVAVTGASGYVGSLIVRALSEEMRVVSLVRTPKSNSDHVWYFDMSEHEMAETLRLAAVTHVIHSAWEMQGSSLGELERICVTGTKRLIAATKAVGMLQVIFISTISAFEGARSSYGKTKLEAEAVVRAQGGIVLRLGMVWGTGKGGMFGSLSALVTRFRVIPLMQIGRAHV